jgi:hypothetical protein
MACGKGYHESQPSLTRLAPNPESGGIKERDPQGSGRTRSKISHYWKTLDQSQNIATAIANKEEPRCGADCADGGVIHLKT